MAPPPPPGTEPEPYSLPSKLARGVESAGFKWLVLKVDRRLSDWRASLLGAKLRIGASGLDEVLIFAPGALARKERLAAWCDSSSEAERRLLFPLRPKNPASNHLLCDSRVTAFLRIVCVEKGNPGFTNSEERLGGGDSIVALNPMPDKNGLPPLLSFWRTGTVAAGAFERLKLRLFRNAGPSIKVLRSMEGKFTDAPHLKLTGRADAGTGRWHYLVAALDSGKRAAASSMVLYEAQVMLIDRDPGSFQHLASLNAYGPAKQVEEDEAKVDTGAEGGKPEPGEKVGYKEARMTATERFGTDPRRRAKHLEGGRQVTDSNVKEVFDDDTLQALTSRAKRSLEGEKGLLEQELELLRAKMPAFDLEAKEPEAIFKKGLAAMAPWEYLDAEDAEKGDDLLALFRDQGRQLLDLFKKPPGELLQVGEAKIADICEDRLVYSVVVARANAAIVTSDAKDAKRFVRQLAVLRCLLAMYKMKPTCPHRKVDVASRTGLNVASKLLDHWFQYFFRSTTGRSDKVVLKEKVLCHALAWALQLTAPTCRLSIVGNIGVDTNEVKRLATLLSCSVESKAETADKMDLRLKAPFKMPDYHQGRGGQQGKNKKRRM